MPQTTSACTQHLTVPKLELAAAYLSHCLAFALPGFGFEAGPKAFELPMLRPFQSEEKLQPLL